MSKKIGRNDLCFCGSGKKYKRCCLLKEQISVPSCLRQCVADCGYDERVGDVLVRAYGFVMKRRGACHAVSSVLYVALSELGLSPVLCVGVVRGVGKMSRYCFDHSWIELNGEVLDLAIANSFGGEEVSNPIVGGYNIFTKEKPAFLYGVSDVDLDRYTYDGVLSLSFVEYMDRDSNHRDGLWSVVNDILDTRLDIDMLREKYHNVVRKHVNDIVDC